MNIPESKSQLINQENKEQWKEITGATGYYVSNFGRVKNKKTITFGGKIKSYLRVSIRYDSGKVLGKKVHRLVAEAFIKNPDNLETVNHKDFNGHNNHFTNLEWLSAKDNILHGKSCGRCVPVGIGDEKALTIYTYHLSKYPGRHRICSEAFGISGATYEKHVNGKVRNKLFKKIFIGGIK
jgi:hypothetical protein